MVMMGLFITMLVSLILSIILSIPASDNELSIPFFISFVILLVSCFLFFYPTLRIDDSEYKRADPYVTHELIALADKHSINGRIHLRRGIVNEVYQYTYAYELPNGGMKTQRADNDITIVYFTDDIPPCAKWYKETRKFWYYEEFRYTCDIFIPTDALVADYSVDLQ